MIEECLVVEFHVEGDGCPLATASESSGVDLDARPPQRRPDGTTLLRFSATDSDGSLAAALDADDRIRYLHTASDGQRTDFRCVSLSPCVVHRLVDRGFLAESLRYAHGEERYTGAVVGRDVLSDVLEAAGETVGVSVRRLYPLGPGDSDPVAARWNITPRQEAALRAAVEAGYFEVPREVTASEVADELDISKSAFLERLRRGQSRLFGREFGTGGSD